MAEYNDFLKIDIRVGKVVDVQDFPEAIKPMYKIRIDFGLEIGIKQSCAQLVKTYTKEDLMGRLVLGVVNLTPRKIGPEFSEILTLGLPDENNDCILIAPDKEAFLGGRLC